MYVLLPDTFWSRVGDWGCCVFGWPLARCIYFNGGGYGGRGIVEGKDEKRTERVSVCGIHTA